MISTQFNHGNFNSFEKLVDKILPAKIDLIRHEIIPAIDRVLRSMLGEETRAEKESVNIVQRYTKDKGLVSLNCVIVYNCYDFLVPNAPDEAIQQDTEDIKNYLAREDAELKNVQIDTKSGYLTVEYVIPVDRS